MLDGLSLDAFSLPTIGGGGAIVAIVVVFILWRLLKVALKIVLFIVVMAVLAAGVAIYLERKGTGLALPVPEGALKASTVDAAMNAE